MSKKTDTNKSISAVSAGDNMDKRTPAANSGQRLIYFADKNTAKSGFIQIMDSNTMITKIKNNIKKDIKNHKYHIDKVKIKTKKNKLQIKLHEEAINNLKNLLVCECIPVIDKRGFILYRNVTLCNVEQILKGEYVRWT